ncbi:MAG: hypothetical protein NTY62_04290 [Euryarchaeota archaeon]|nr:hypothetical protein [Euryarchaeota archaeon]
MPMKPISLDRAKEIATEKNLRPGKVRGTTEVEFTRGGSPPSSSRSSPRRVSRSTRAAGS